MADSRGGVKFRGGLIQGRSGVFACGGGSVCGGVGCLKRVQTEATSAGCAWCSHLKDLLIVAAKHHRRPCQAAFCGVWHRQQHKCTQ